jgi:hypothetical protein
VSQKGLPLHLSGTSPNPPIYARSGHLGSPSKELRLICCGLGQTGTERLRKVRNENQIRIASED